MNIRIGNGIDFHRLIESENRPLMLGGIELPGHLALQGHSDADVLLHALCDAMAGAMAIGDIGTFFPDTDVANQNLDSTIFLQRYMDIMKEKNFCFINIDITMIGEHPKILPHRDTIRKKLATLLTLGIDRIGLKATTTEKMGALGRSEGLACLVTVLLEKK